MGELYSLEPDEMKGVKEYLLHHTTILRTKGVLKLIEASFPTPPLLLSLLLLITILQCLHFPSNAGIKQNTLRTIRHYQITADNDVVLQHLTASNLQHPAIKLQQDKPCQSPKSLDLI